MNDDANRESPPPYLGEKGFALWHFSDDPSITRFVPRRATRQPDEPEMVWAIDERHAPLYWFPRDCPRAMVWATSQTSDDDRQIFLGDLEPPRLLAIERSELSAMTSRTLYGYRLPVDSFRPLQVGGYWVSDDPVEPIEIVAMTDLCARIALAGIELRVMESLWPWWDDVIRSTLEFSGCRLSLSPNFPGST